jgi:hypothetical protein
MRSGVGSRLRMRMLLGTRETGRSRVQSPFVERRPVGDAFLSWVLTDQSWNVDITVSGELLSHLSVRNP